MSGRTYQTLMKYRGSLTDSPQYTGIEYDFEVPDNIVVASPGGVSSIQHHWPKGFYSNSASTYDVYAGEGNRYPYGEFGNLYQVGQNAPTEMGMYPPGADRMYTGNQSTMHTENFTATGHATSSGFSYQGPGSSRNGQTQVPGMEMISAPDTAQKMTVQQAVKSEITNLTHKIVLPNIWVVLLMFVFLYIALDFIVNAGETIIYDRFHGGKAPGWKWLLLYGAIFIGLAIALGFTVQDPFFALKKIEE